MMYRDFLRTDRVRAVLVRSRAVSASTNTYWKLRGITIMVKTRIPHIERSIYSGLEVKSSTKTFGRNWDRMNMLVVKPSISFKMVRIAFFTRSVA